MHSHHSSSTTSIRTVEKLHGWPKHFAIAASASKQTGGQRILTDDRIARRAGITDFILKIERSLLQHAVIDDLMIPFAAYTAAETPNAFQWAGQPPIIARSREGSRSRNSSNIRFSGPTQVNLSDGISNGSAVFARFTNVINAQTDRPRYCVRTNRPLTLAIVTGGYRCDAA